MARIEQPLLITREEKAQPRKARAIEPGPVSDHFLQIPPQRNHPSLLLSFLSLAAEQMSPGEPPFKAQLFPAFSRSTAPSALHTAWTRQREHFVRAGLCSVPFPVVLCV